MKYLFFINISLNKKNIKNNFYHYAKKKKKKQPWYPAGSRCKLPIFFLPKSEGHHEYWEVWHHACAAVRLRGCTRYITVPTAPSSSNKMNSFKHVGSLITYQLLLLYYIYYIAKKHQCFTMNYTVIKHWFFVSDLCFFF